MTKPDESEGQVQPLMVREIMTAPAMSVGEDTTLGAICRMMYKLRIHRVPVVRDGQVCGIISSLDVCAAVARGELLDE
jgi:signal-transduction protein with cAMP-binding, CBS, and nucleotidyltransferase domain